MPIYEWVFQDWRVNAGRPEQQVFLAWFRLAQWAARRGRLARLAIVAPYWLISSVLLGIELPAGTVIGPRLRLYHLSGIVLNPHCTLGRDCQLRHGVTVGNKVDRAGNELGVATIGNGVELGAGCAVIGGIHVGDHARIGALAAVTKSVPPWGVVVGNPGRLIRVETPMEAVPGKAE
jgi:putative colanic acid biosynthesis acetyltransferase WcaB